MLSQPLSQQANSVGKYRPTHLVVVELSISMLGDSGNCQSCGWPELADILVAKDSMSLLSLLN
jgi:hypothetical protein